MEKVSEFYFKYNADKYFKLRDGIEAVFPGLTVSDPEIARLLSDMDAIEHRIKHYVMDKYCTPGC